MDGARWLLPDGIDEVLPPQAERLEHLRRRLLDLYSRWGFELVMPPFIEYTESLLTGTGNDLDLQTFKITDQLTGRLMGVRADITPQAARIDAHRLQRETPVRLCYLGTVLRTRADGFAGSRSPLQVGAELFGHAGIESDIEILALMIETLEVTGITDIHLDLGHVGIFRHLARQAQLDGSQETLLFEALQRKARPEIEEFLRLTHLPAPMRRLLSALPELNGGAEVLDLAATQLAAAQPEVHAALNDLRAIVAALDRLAPQVTVHIDLAELRGYRYQTGAVFAAFIATHGREIARGGRYDDIGKIFGRARPATGFSADLKTLITLGNEPEPARGVGIFAPWPEEAALHAAIRALRAAGERVIVALPGQTGTAEAMNCDRVLKLEAGTWTVTPVTGRVATNE